MSSPPRKFNKKTRGTIGTTATKLYSINDFRWGVKINAHPSNTGTIYVGYDSNVAASGTYEGEPYTGGTIFRDEGVGCHRGEIWIIASIAAQIYFAEETTSMDKVGW